MGSPLGSSMKRMFHLALILLAGCVPGADTGEDGGSRDAGTDSDSGSSVSVDWDGGARFFDVPISPLRSCHEHCAQMGGQCTMLEYGVRRAATILDYGECERFYFCRDIPRAEDFCSRNDPEPPVMLPLLGQSCACGPLADAGTIVDAGSNPDVKVLHSDVSMEILSCRQVCSGAGLSCATFEWDVRGPSAAYFGYSSCSTQGECDDVPAETMTCITGTFALSEQRCACR